MTTPEPPTYLAPVQELDRLRIENQRLRHSAIKATSEEAAWSKAKAIHLDEELTKANAALAEAEEARDEFEKSYVHFHAAYEQAEARVDQLTDTLALRSDALNRTGESNDQLRATLAAISRIVGALEETVELDCDPVDGGCHDLDLTDDGQCSLVADLNRVRAIIRGDAK